MLMLHSAQRSPAVAKALCVFGIVLCILVIIKQSSHVPLLQRLRQSLVAGGEGLKRRLEISEQLWEDSVIKRHEMYASFVDPLKPMFPTVFADNPFTIWDYFPPTFSCPWEMQRIGRLGDGGKWMCGMSRYETPAAPKERPCVVYSFGVRYETSFEESILQKTNCELYGVDFSVSNFSAQLLALPEEQKKRAHFLQAGVAPGESNTLRHPPFYSIKDLMVMNGHEYIDILKMDIEQYEFNAMDKFMQDFSGKPLPVGQFLVEIHLMGLQNELHRPNFPEFMEWWERLEACGLRPVWTELNLLAVTLHAEDSLPRCSEYSFINVQHPKNVLLHE